jgi:hypothetical protein
MWAFMEGGCAVQLELLHDHFALCCWFKKRDEAAEVVPQ